MILYNSNQMHESEPVTVHLYLGRAPLVCIYFLIFPALLEAALSTNRAPFEGIRHYPLFQLTGLLNRCGIGHRYPQSVE